jgi:hypothetical protein
MTTTLRTRVGAVAAAGIALLFAITGCSTISTYLPHTTSTSVKPSVGDCWRSTVATAQQAAAWTASAAVACASGHQLYTYAVETVKSSASSWRSDSGDLDDSIAEKAYRACNQDFFEVFADAPAEGRLTRYFFVAPEAQWKKGARWVRCDIGVFKTGSRYTRPSFAALPPQISTLTAQLEATPDLFADCVTTTDPSGDTGPLSDPETTVADCTQDYQWRFESSFSIPGAQDAPYPSDEFFNSTVQSSCGDAADQAGRAWVAYYPTPSTWAQGDRGGSCWFYHDTAPQT